MPSNISVIYTSLKVLSVRNNSVGYNAFSRCCLPKMRRGAKFPPKNELITVEDHPRSSTLVPIESTYAISY